MAQTLQRVGFIGGGRVTRLLAARWQQAGISHLELIVTEPDDAAFAKLTGAYPRTRRAPLEEAGAADVVFVALHPPLFAATLAALRPILLPNAVVVSLAPKVTLAALGTGLGTTRVVRMIPNAPSIIGRGYNPVAFGAGFDADCRAVVEPLFTPWGAWPEVPETNLEAYAILTGMGPTYYWYQWQALRDLAGQFGLTPEATDHALTHMLDGARETLLTSGLAPADVMDLIPVRPLEAIQPTVDEAYRTTLPALYARITPA